MKPRTIKKIDFWLGIPLCFLFTTYEKIRKTISAKRRTEPGPNKYLFIKLIEQGATVLAYPALKRAVDISGASNVFFCVFAENRHILDILDIIPSDNIFEIRQRNLFVFICDAVRVFLRARRLRIDTVLDLEFFSRASALMCYLTGASKRVGYHRYTSELPYRGDLMTHRVQYNPYLHAAHAYMLLVESSLLSPADEPLPKIKAGDVRLCRPHFSPSEPQLQRATALLHREGKAHPTKPYVVVNPNAGDMLPLRKWEPEKFVQLVNRLLDSYRSATIILTGSPSEAEAVDTLFRNLSSERIVNLAGKTDLIDLMAIYSMSDLLVTNDSGPGHFATLTDVSCVVLFGPETPKLFAPLGDNVHVIYEGLACSPCINAFNQRFSPCTNNLCMKSISVDTVFDKVHKILSVR
jgi:ADP-heptose:LPS heptosyltransferase